MTNGASLILADGMGGHKGGALASRLVVDSFVQALDGRVTWGEIPSLLQHAARLVNDELVALGEEQEQLEDLGSTVVTAVVSGDRVMVAHAGDSRAWLVTPDDVRLLTTDHSLAQNAVSRGSATDLATAKQLFGGAIFRCLGATDFEGLEIGPLGGFMMPEGSVLLLTSDGAHDHLTETDILDAFCSSASARDALEDLAHLAFARGSQDNITLVAAESGGSLRRDEQRPRRALSSGLYQEAAAGSAALRGEEPKKLPPPVRPKRSHKILGALGILLILILSMALAVRWEAAVQLVSKFVHREGSAVTTSPQPGRPLAEPLQHQESVPPTASEPEKEVSKEPEGLRPSSEPGATNRQQPEPDPKEGGAP